VQIPRKSREEKNQQCTPGDAEPVIENYRGRCVQNLSASAEGVLDTEQFLQ
jgi:hypothetical protein